MANGRTVKKILAWIKLSRPPFLSVGAFPFILGTLLAWKLEGVFNAHVFIAGMTAVILIMLSTYHSGEYFDYEGDTLSHQMHRNRFAGGSRVLQSGALSPRTALWTSIITFAVAAGIGIYIQFGLQTGPYTILLGSLGIFPGFFYSTRPIRLVDRGVGEIFIGFCYGWLPVASAFYIQAGYIAPVIHWIGIPIGFTIFNVIFLNEFPDYAADKTVGKKNLLVRLGIERGALIYSTAAVLTWVSVLFTLKLGVSLKALYLFLPVMALSAVLILMVMNRKYENKRTLEVLCGLNIAINIGTTFSYIVAYV
jgi:1,4-dihydroxy-2-naphthoate octaprenyltransferase